MIESTIYKKIKRHINLHTKNRRLKPAVQPEDKVADSRQLTATFLIQKVEKHS